MSTPSHRPIWASRDGSPSPSLARSRRNAVSCSPSVIFIGLCYCQGRNRRMNALGNIQISKLSTSVSRNAADLVADQPILVRDFIHAALYHPQFGYFSTKPEAVGVLPESISFDSLEGRRAYMQHLHLLYKQNDVSWFTPVELFKPWYGYAIAEYILRIVDPAFPLQVFEIGGGTGTCARNVLDYIKLRAPSIYESMSYVSVDISEALVANQVKSVHAVRSHKSRFLAECRNANERAGWGEVDERPCFVIMLEVLDNQPHDLLFKNFPSSWLETYVTKDHERSHAARLLEIYKPVQDPVIQRCIDIIGNGAGLINPVPSWLSTVNNFLSKFLLLQQKAWLPTGSLQLLETLYGAHPNMVLIASDFSILPDVKIEGERAPLVASKRDGITKDHSTYLDAKGDADIFFPTDFRLLRELDNHCYLTSTFAAERKLHRKRKSCIVTSAQFMRRFADTSKTKTKDGYNPLLEDYSNTNFYLSALV